MDLLESVKKDKAYNKYKLIVKNWEKEFKAKSSRTPSKFDIKDAPTNIKYAYKKYFQLKSAALQSSLSICEAEYEPFGSPDPRESVVYTANSPQSDSSSQHLLIPSFPSGQEIEKLLSRVPRKEVLMPSSNQEKISPASNKDLHLVDLNQEELGKPRSQFTVNLSKKLFDSKKFSLRNPRKSLKSKLIFQDKAHNTGKENSSDSQNNFEGLEVIDANHTISCALDNSLNLSSSLYLNISHITNQQQQPTRYVDEAWLERATSTNVSFKTTQPIPQLEPHEKFGIANIEATVATTIIDDKHIDYVENSESESDDAIMGKLKPALKKRKITETKCETHKKEQDKYFSENNDITPSSDFNNKVSLKHNTRLCRKNAPKKIKQNYVEERPPDITEYVPFGLESNLKPRLPNPAGVIKLAELSTKLISSQSNMDRLEKKISSGTLNENFLKINIEKKIFVRGKKNLNFSKYKKQLWKDKKALHASMEFPEQGRFACFKCGAHGHMARYCTALKGETLLPLESYKDNDIPTLEDMQNIVTKETNNVSLFKPLNTSAFTPSQIPESFMKLLAEKSSQDTEVRPIYSSYSQERPPALYEVLQKFGHSEFRPGQEEAIMRILSGMSTLLILSTGGGKSLCYQLPAYIYSQHYKCITLVISPLVSLMEDQVFSMPEFLKAGCLHTNQPPTQRKKIVQCLKNGEINVLLISPEALVSDGAQGFAGLFTFLPPIAFACIDEAHCVSQWSHNFRPSYLMICKVLQEKLKVKCILGLTATASQVTIKSVIHHINILDGLSGVITNPTLPDNLCLSVSLEKDKDRGLLSLLNSERISEYNSIIVYCIRRDECERVAAILRSCLQETGKLNMEKQSNKRKRMSYVAEAYHAGMSAAQRKKIQKNFMDGTLRIIVATVAFGMGINKGNIRCIIHYNMPSSFESYVQEVGRAGRDGKYAYCHLLMDTSSNDKSELLKHIHANTIDRPTIRRLLQKLFIPCQCASAENSSDTAVTSRCKGHEVGIPIDTTVEELDVPSENIATILCYLELHPKQYIKLLNNAYTACKVSSYGGPQKIFEAAKYSPPLAMAYLLEGRKNPEVTKHNILEFDVIEVASAIGWESGMVKYHLKNLEWITEDGLSRRSPLKIEFNTLGFRIKSPGDLSPGELDSILDDLHSVVLSQEKAMLYQLEESNRAFTKLGNYSVQSSTLSEEVLVEKSNEMKNIIKDYFQRENNLPMDVMIEQRPLEEEKVAADVRALICAYRDCTFTGRSIARIFQGISSPNYPAIVWSRCKFWRSHIHEDFYGLMRVATQQIIQMKN